jgi:hypothetical protein
MLRNIESMTKVAVIASFKVITLTRSGRADETTNILEKSAFHSSLEMGNSRIKISTIAKSDGLTVLMELCMEFERFCVSIQLLRIMSSEINDKFFEFLTFMTKAMSRLQPPGTISQSKFPQKG